jgi:Protein of unknown function (DUF4013)
VTHHPEPTLARRAYGPGRLARLGRFVVSGAIGTVLCAGPVTAVVALGWLTRRQGFHARDRFGAAEEAPGWLLGPREVAGRPSGRLARALGGLAANIRAGLMALVALMAWTLPFTLLWLGAWWAGWENSFNKGYEQAFVGPSIFLLGAILAALILPALPLMLAHLAAEDRLSAAFELRRLRSLIAQAGWRIPALSLLTVIFALPFAGAMDRGPEAGRSCRPERLDRTGACGAGLPDHLGPPRPRRPRLWSRGPARCRPQARALGRRAGSRGSRPGIRPVTADDHAVVRGRHGRDPSHDFPDPGGTIP